MPGSAMISIRFFWLNFALLAFLAAPVLVHAAEPTVREGEKQRIDVINKVRPAVVAIFAQGGQGGGSGVLIDKEGYALTNFHVVQGTGPVMQCGLADGILYDAVIVGWDKVGDVALIRLLPKKEGTPFPVAAMGDSDKVHEGDWCLTMGNPFLLATDFSPTVSFGMVSGVHRYQYPEGTLLEYTDCIQVDASVNPGNSGGPLFNSQGEVIGINGRISFDKRRRINSGVGYAISINQIKNFMGHLYAGLDADHASLLRVQSLSDEIPQLVVKEVLEDSDVARRGVQVGDTVVAFAGRSMSTTNEFKNILGIFPKDWRLPLTYRHENKRQETLVRLMGVQQKEPEEDKPMGPGPMPMRPAPAPIPDGPAKKMYKPQKGFVNYYFNELNQKRVWEAFEKLGKFGDLKGEWVIQGDLQLKTNKTDFQVWIGDHKGDDGTVNTQIKLHITNVDDFALEPLRQPKKDELIAPNGSGGLLMALFHYHLLLREGPGGFKTAAHGGMEPFYPYPVDGTTPKDLMDLRVDTEVLRTEYASVPVKWYFSKSDQKLLGFEVFIEPNTDPCEVYLSDYRAEDGRQMPHRLEVRNGDKQFCVMTLKSFKLNK
jgi:S1-C subfamily serine protease